MHQDQEANKPCGDEKGVNPKQERKGALTLILGLIFVYVLLWHLRVALQWLGLRFGPEGPPSVMIWNWIAVAGALAFVVLVERRRLNSIGFRRPAASDILWALAFWVAGLILTMLAHALLQPPPGPGMDAMMQLSIPVLLGVVVTASITEEVIFRGFLIERLRELTGSIWLGAAISFVLFLIPHVLFFGPMWIVVHSYTTILIYALYLWRRNLWSCMVLHLMSNLLILLPALGVE